MSTMLSFVGLIVGPPLLGVVLALIQLVVYRASAAVGLTDASRIPPFLMLWLRGLVLVVALAAALGIWNARNNAPKRADVVPAQTP